MNYSRDVIINRFNEGENMKFIFFWGHKPSADGSITKSCFSQWFDCRFNVDGVEYSTAEQYMMSQKALLFGDKKIYNEIMSASHPNEFKSLGRKISGFDGKIWDKYKTDIVIKGNMAKFSQNQELKYFLLGTNKRILVEASPYDTIWGIGMSAKNSGVTNPNCWKGENLLGFCLMEVRDMIIAEESKYDR